jgi:hypothetical protein
MNLKNLVATILSAILIFGAGFFTDRFTHKSEIKTITITKTETKYVKSPDNADYDTLKMWAKSPIKNEITFKGDMLFVHSYDANKSTDTSAKIEVGSSDNFKYYIGIGVASALIGGYAVYRLVK